MVGSVGRSGADIVTIGAAAAAAAADVTAAAAAVVKPGRVCAIDGSRGEKIRAVAAGRPVARSVAAARSFTPPAERGPGPSLPNPNIPI